MCIKESWLPWALVRFVFIGCFEDVLGRGFILYEGGSLFNLIMAARGMAILCGGFVCERPLLLAVLVR